MRCYDWCIANIAILFFMKTRVCPHRNQSEVRYEKTTNYVVLERDLFYWDTSRPLKQNKLLRRTQDVALVRTMYCRYLRTVCLCQLLRK